MDPQLRQLSITIFIIILVIGIIWGAYELLIRTPVGQGLNKFLGGIGAVLGSVGAQLTTCATDGYFNVPKGCYIGIAGIGIGLVYAGAWILKTFGARFKQTRISKNIQDDAQLRGQSEVNSLNEMLNRIDLNKFSQLKDNPFDNAVRDTILNKASNDQLVDSIQKSDLSPENMRQKMQEAKNNYEAQQKARQEEFEDENDGEYTWDEVENESDTYIAEP